VHYIIFLSNKDGVIMSFVTIETARMILRDHYVEDLDSHHLLLSDAEVMYYLEDIHTKTLKESQENLINSITAIEKENRDLFFFRMIHKELNQHIGEIGFHVVNQNSKGKHVHLGYFSHKLFWGNGFISEAIKAIVEFAFVNDVYLITSGCLDEHQASKRVLEKNGFVTSLLGEKEEWHQGYKKSRVNYELYKDCYGKEKLKL